MTDRLFKPNNPNRDIFVVETEEGSDTDDNMNSMIGDAVAKHVSELVPFTRQIWEHYVLTGGENLFDFIPSPKFHDADPFSLKVEDLDNVAKNLEDRFRKQATMGKFYNHEKEVPPPVEDPNYRLNDKMLAAVDEAIAEEEDRRVDSDDAYLQNDGMICFEDWEQNPGLFKHVDIPATPQNIPIYCGNVTQNFYDEFPEGHRDSKIINQCIMMLNRDIDQLTDRYGDFVKSWLDNQRIQDPFVYRCLVHLVDLLIQGEKDPEETVRRALKAIDDQWGKEYRERILRELSSDGIYQLMVHKDKEWSQMVKGGANVYSLVKGLGKVLFEKFRPKMNARHWSMYRSLKDKYSPRVMLTIKDCWDKRRDIDLNRCRLSDLERGLKISHSKAVAVWEARPFESIEEMRKKGFIDKDIVVAASKLDEVSTEIQKLAEKALETRNMRVLTSFSQKLIEKQRSNELGLSSREWSSVWSFYRMTKGDTLAQIQGKGETP